MNMIGIIVFSIVVGVIMSLHPEETAPLMKVRTVFLFPQMMFILIFCDFYNFYTL